MAIDIGPLQVANRSIGPLQPAGTTALTENLADSLTLSEGLGLGFGDAFSDNATISDTPVVVLDLEYSFSDTVSFSDSTVYQLFLPESCSDQVVLSDSSGFVVDCEPGGSDSFTLSDSIQVALGEVEQIFSDVCTFTDNLEFDLIVSELLVNDSFTLSDSGPQVYINAPTFDNLVFVDSIQTQITTVIYRSATDSLSFFDLIANTPIPIPINLGFSDQIFWGEYQIYNNYAFGDQFFFSDSVLVWSGSLQQQDQFTIVDAIPQVVLGVCETLSDSFSLGDAIVPIITIPESVGDHVLFTDQVGIATPLSIDPNDDSPPSINNVLFTDSILVYLGTSAFSDQIIFLDNFSLLESDLYQFSESLTFNDGIVVNLALAITPLTQVSSDTLIFYDAYQISLIQLASPLLTETNLDSFSLTDSISFSLSAFDVNSFSDPLLFSDTFQLGLGLFVGDSFSLSDSPQTALREVYETISDSVTLTDNVTISGMSVQLTITLSDSVSLADLIQEGGSVVPVIVDTLYIRRYLNDVLVKG